MNLLNKLWFITICYMLYIAMMVCVFYSCYMIFNDPESELISKILMIFASIVFVISIGFWTYAYILQFITIIRKHDRL